MFYDYANVPAAELAPALHTVTRWFASIGLSLDWVDYSSCGEWQGGDKRPPVCDTIPQLTVILASGPMAERLVPRPEILGLAPGSSRERGRIAYVFYGRVRQARADRVVDWLAVVIAHELGHLLLPFGSHSETGLMRAAWRTDELPPLDANGPRFTGWQARRMRERIRAAGSLPVLSSRVR